MSSLLVALPIVCCLLIPAVIYVGALLFRRPEKRPLDTDERKENLPHSIERDLRK